MDFTTEATGYDDDTAIGAARDGGLSCERAAIGAAESSGLDRVRTAIIAAGGVALGESSSINSRSFASGRYGITGIVPAHLPRTENANANLSVGETPGAHRDVGRVASKGENVVRGRKVL